MELAQFTAGLADSLGGGAFTLSTETRAALQSSLVLLKAREKFVEVKLWGRIRGIHRDVYIAHGIGGSGDEVGDKKAFYSADNGITFLELPKVHPVTAASALRITKRFTGSASHEYTVQEPGPAPDSEPLELPAEVEASRTVAEDTNIVTSVIKEDQRMAAVVAAVDYECAAVPRGAYMQGAGTDNNTSTNAPPIKVTSFAGLPSTEAGKLHSYVHFRKPTKDNQPSGRAQQDSKLDFLDPISEDMPKGAWALQYERGGASVLLKSTVWPGYCFYHVANTPQYGYVYNGLGIRNQDLAFMLPSKMQQ